MRSLYYDLMSISHSKTAHMKKKKMVDKLPVGKCIEVDVNKRTATMHYSCSLLTGDKIWPVDEQLSVFFLFYWPKLIFATIECMF